MTNDEILSQAYYIQVSDGSAWAIPVSTIAMHHAMHYASEEEFMDYLYTKTLPLFEDVSKITHWATTQMTWDDVKNDAVMVTAPPNKVDFYREWFDCKTIVK